MYLQGFNIGGYLSQAELRDEDVSTFFSEDDVKKIKNWGFNTIRLPVDYFFFEDDRNPYVYVEDRMQQIDKVFQWTQDHDVFLIFDLHKAPGHSFTLKERSLNDIWNDRSEHRDRFVRIWEMLSKRYSDFNNIIYDVMNEPVAPNAALWYDVAEDAISAIRANDQEHYIAVESNLWGRAASFKTMRKFADDKIIYSFHYYEPILVTHQFAEWVPFYDLHQREEWYPGNLEGTGELQDQVAQRDKYWPVFFDQLDGEWNRDALEQTLAPVLAFQQEYDVPILCGEFGCIAKADPQVRINWTNDVVSLFKQYGISYTYWNYKNLDFGIYDFTEQYADNPNYANEERLDRCILGSLQSGI